MKDYTVTEEINKYLIGSTIIDSFVADQEVGFEGGLTVIFEKDNQRGILIYGYTEIGEWLEYLQVGKVKINDFEKWVYTDEHYKIELEYVKSLIEEYKI